MVRSQADTGRRRKECIGGHLGSISNGPFEQRRIAATFVEKWKVHRTLSSVKFVTLSVYASHTVVRVSLSGFLNEISIVLFHLKRRCDFINPSLILRIQRFVSLSFFIFLQYHARYQITVPSFCLSSFSLNSVDTCYVYRQIERNDLPSLKLPKFDFARVETTLERVLNISSGTSVLWFDVTFFSPPLPKILTILSVKLIC